MDYDIKVQNKIHKDLLESGESMPKQENSRIESHRSLDKKERYNKMQHTDDKSLKMLRIEAREALKPLADESIQNADGTSAIITMSGVSEMLSSKAVKQSLKNGFTTTQHIEAVKNIAGLFRNAVFKEAQSQRHVKEHVKGYRIYNADFQNANAVISVQERKRGNNVIYFLKLEELQSRDI